MCKYAKYLFSALFVGMIFLVILLKAGLMLHVPFPDALEIGKEHSYLEGRQYQTRPDLTLDTVSTGEFQNSFEQYVADMIPCRDDVLLYNAAIQRASIHRAAQMAGYSIYPTFYGSDYYYNSATDSAMQIQDKLTPQSISQHERIAEAINQFSSRHPQVNTVVFMPDRMSFSGFNPIAPLTSHRIDNEFIDTYLFNNLQDNIHGVNYALVLPTNFERDYFHGDHHWDIDIAYKAYVNVLPLLKPHEEPLVIQNTKTWESIPYYGPNCRAGLCLIKNPDHITDVTYDESAIDVYCEGEKYDLEFTRHRELYDLGNQDSDLYFNRYGEYFHYDPGLLTYVNNDNPDGETLVMIVDSYSNNCERFFAEHYAKVYCLDLRHYEGTLDDFFEKHQVDDLLYWMHDGAFIDEKILHAIEP